MSSNAEFRNCTAVWMRLSDNTGGGWSEKLGLELELELELDFRHVASSYPGSIQSPSSFIFLNNEICDNFSS